MTSTVAPLLSPERDLERGPDTSVEAEYRRLMRMLRAHAGHFALFPVESNLAAAARDALLQRLAAELAADGLSARVVRLSQDAWNLVLLLDAEEDKPYPDVMVVVGLDDTPGIIPEAGAPPRRPPALAALNLAREHLHQRLAGPLLLWCDPLSYTALQEHAPDFLDHYSALFSFIQESPEHVRAGVRTGSRLTEAPGLQGDARANGSLAAAAFYEEELARLKEPTPERARALVGLAEALWSQRGPGTPARLRRAAALAREALSILATEPLTPDHARAQVVLGVVYSELPTGNRRSNLQRAIACYQAALRVYAEKDFPAEWATTRNNLGNAYWSLPTGDRGENLQRAIESYQAALRVTTEKDFPTDWARTQNNLGNAYWSLPTGDRGENLQRAIACYEAALRVYAEKDFPAEWATTQNNLGNAYADLPTGDRGENLQRAIACYQAALRVRTEKDFPTDWAMTQNSLGITYRNLPTGDRGENLQRAIACYQAALRIYTEKDFPADWAMTQNNLGTAYAELPTGDRGENLQRAIECFQAALRVRTEKDFPADWAMTQWNLALVLEEQEDVAAARVAFDAAARGYRTVGDEQEAREAEAERDRLTPPGAEPHRPPGEG